MDTIPAEKRQRNKTAVKFTLQDWCLTRLHWARCCQTQSQGSAVAAGGPGQESIHQTQHRQLSTARVGFWYSNGGLHLVYPSFSVVLAYRALLTITRQRKGGCESLNMDGFGLSLKVICLPYPQRFNCISSAFTKISFEKWVTNPGGKLFWNINERHIECNPLGSNTF